MKIKLLSLAFALTAFAGTASAQGYYMEVKTSNGTQVFDVDDVEEVTFKEKPYQATIASGTDLYTYFSENSSTLFTDNRTVVINLEENGTYTQSGNIEIPAGYNVTIAGAESRPNITFTADAGFTVQSPFTLQGVNIDASSSTSPLISLSTTADESLLGATGTGDYYNIMGSIDIKGCNIEGLKNNVIYDNNVKYCLEALNIDNCVMHLTTETLSYDAVIAFRGGYINDLTVKNSTVYNTGSASASYFVRYNNAGRCDRGGYETNSVNFMNNTFHKISSNQWANYSGFAGRATSLWVMTDNIFVNCSKEIARRFLGGRGNQNTATFANNTYMYKEGDENKFDSTDGVAGNYDTSGTAIEEDPGFNNADEGDFTVSGAKQLELRTGDPRWLPETK